MLCTFQWILSSLHEDDTTRQCLANVLWEIEGRHQMQYCSNREAVTRQTGHGHQPSSEFRQGDAEVQCPIIGMCICVNVGFILRQLFKVYTI